ncbi:hypothetical protein Mal48_30050 [Thalassoglobus polymorphus]|uniref:Uncharacterized protein n=1 Tax=Thalassoglobus polymorphus TaxID=2527994 RepID=A0A517QQ37_9PLAN|nr:hypothetical protein Mal48_30050 [Thalassoglobus polymorphus]
MPELILRRIERAVTQEIADKLGDQRNSEKNSGPESQPVCEMNLLGNQFSEDRSLTSFHKRSYTGALRQIRQS